MEIFKHGDKVRGKAFGLSEYVTGKIIEIDNDDPEVMYLVETPASSYWLETDTVTLVEEKDNLNYDNLLKFVNENKISLDTINEVKHHLSKIEKLDCDIENTKKLWKQHEDEAQRMYDKLSKLKIERYELLK